ncbi:MULTISPECIES: hypothetical protein [Bacillus cereus group]|uniref:Uncharacterized protein n=1 Tax=Bacillus proteolyticus TaxID=2026192 RepID=A0ABV3IHX2_9BACI|nr:MULTISPECIES: hypothetical protein [Bacillus cereus group]KXY03353.1 hypothetical protein AT260_08075 [Bacillus wiedmannii]MBJ8107674.1 hypothetical protein [Bacillus cereus group sp. N8]MED1059933.1 hypothetical protein [Bacillus mycoides]MED1115808.1 hypothetical protein [Bacillus paramycoides]
MFLKASYSDFISLIILITVILALWRLKVWSNKKYNVPKVFQWFPKKWGKRKISEQFFQSKLDVEGKGIWIIYYAVDLYVVTIPLQVKKYNTL